MIDWQVTSVESKLIELQLEFDKPLNVSQSELPDALLVQAMLSAFPDENGNFLPPAVMKRKEIPIQFPSQSEAETVEGSALTAMSACASISTVRVVLSFFM